MDTEKKIINGHANGYLQNRGLLILVRPENRLEQFEIWQCSEKCASGKILQERLKNEWETWATVKCAMQRRILNLCQLIHTLYRSRAGTTKAPVSSDSSLIAVQTEFNRLLIISIRLKSIFEGRRRSMLLCRSLQGCRQRREKHKENRREFSFRRHSNIRRRWRTRTPVCMHHLAKEFGIWRTNT